jgi:hypothetical protein
VASTTEEEVKAARMQTELLIRIFGDMLMEVVRAFVMYLNRNSLKRFRFLMNGRIVVVDT